MLSAVVAATGPHLAPARRQAPALAVDGLIHTTAMLTQDVNFIGTHVGNLALFAQGAGNSEPSRNDTVNIYNAATAQWTTTVVHGIHNSVDATSVGDVAIFAGDNGVAYMFNASSGHWSTAKLAQARYAMAVTTVGSRAIFAGGAYIDRHGVYKPSSAIDIYNARTGRWTARNLSDVRDIGTAVTVGELAIFVGGFGSSQSVAVIYNDATRKWSTTSLSDIPGGAVAVIGDKAMFAGGSGPSGENSVVDIYDARRGRWSSVALSDTRDDMAAATAGSLALFAGGFTTLDVHNTVDIYNSANGQLSASTLPSGGFGLASANLGNVAIFVGGDDCIGASCLIGDAQLYNGGTGQWAQIPLSEARDGIASVTTGEAAIFAGGAYDFPGQNVDLFTLPDLSGSITPHHKNVVTVTLTNSGTSALPGPDSVAIYASTSRTLDGSAVLLGSERVRRTLIAGVKERVSVPISIPGDLLGGRYHLIAAAGPAGQLVQFASTRKTFALGPVPVTSRPDAAGRSVFNAGGRISEFMAWADFPGDLFV